MLTYLSQLTERLLFLCFVITMYTYPSLSPTATYCTTVLEKNNKFIFYTRSTTILRYNNTFRKPSPLKFSPIKKNFLVFVAYGSSYPKNTLIRDDGVPDSALKKKNLEYTERKHRSLRKVRWYLIMHIRKFGNGSEWEKIFRIRQTDADYTGFKECVWLSCCTLTNKNSEHKVSCKLSSWLKHENWHAIF